MLNSHKTLRIATRNSPLALWQAQHIRTILIKKWPGLEIDLLPMSTSGDQFLKDKLLTIGGKGLFVKELEEALLDGRADLAVHSMKDVPSVFPKGLSLAAICKRDNPFDALVSLSYTDFRSLPLGARIGTSSLRRQSQLLVARPDLIIVPLRGNINTRLAKLNSCDFDAIILAVAGLERMSMHNLITQIFNDDILLPACGQGALGIECRSDDTQVKALIDSLNDPVSALCVHSERHVNALLGGNCHVPIAVYCQPLPNEQIMLRANVGTLDGRTQIQSTLCGHQSDAMSIANCCAQELLSAGATKLLEDL